MHIAHRDSAPRFGESAHRSGGIGFVSLLQGVEGSPDNYELCIAQTTDAFTTPRHRHNFDQVRVQLEGSFGFDKDRVQEPGTIGYFCEGTYYQQRGIGRSETLLLQAGGANGNGFMSFRKLYATVNELKSKGEFHDGVFTWHDEHGKKHNQDGYEAAWEAAFGRKLEYPKPRYDSAVIFVPDHFRWIPVEGAPGVAMRILGQFHERGLVLSERRLEAGARCPIAAPRAPVLVFVYSGAGEVAGGPYERHAALRLDRGESAVFSATEATRLLLIQVPQFDAAIAA